MGPRSQASDKTPIVRTTDAPLIILAHHFVFFLCLFPGGSLKVLLLENISGVAASQFGEAGFSVESHKGAMEEAELIEKVRGTSILGVRSKTRITAAILDAAPELVSVGAFCI